MENYRARVDIHALRRKKNRPGSARLRRASLCNRRGCRVNVHLSQLAVPRARLVTLRVCEYGVRGRACMCAGMYMWPKLCVTDWRTTCCCARPLRNLGHKAALPLARTNERASERVTCVHARARAHAIRWRVCVHEFAAAASTKRFVRFASNNAGTYSPNSFADILFYVRLQEIFFKPQKFYNCHRLIIITDEREYDLLFVRIS